MTDKYIDYIYSKAKKAVKDVEEVTDDHIRNAVGSIGYFALVNTGLLDSLERRDARNGKNNGTKGLRGPW